MTNAANFFAAFEACLPAAYEVSCRIRTGSPTSFWLDSPRTVASRRSFGSPVPRRRGLGRQAATRRRHPRVYVFAAGCQSLPAIWNGDRRAKVRDRHADDPRRHRHPDGHRSLPGDGEPGVLRDEALLRAGTSDRDRRPSGLLQRDDRLNDASQAGCVHAATRRPRTPDRRGIRQGAADSHHGSRSRQAELCLPIAGAGPGNILHPPDLIPHALVTFSHVREHPSL